MEQVKTDMIKTGLFYLAVMLLVSCGHADPDDNEEEQQVVTPVTIIPVQNGPMADTITMNATSTFLQKSIVKASANGYLATVKAVVGRTAGKGEVLFVLKTKEAQSIGNAINSLDSSFKFSGLITIRAAITGHITEVDHQMGDYVQDGEQLAVINDVNSFVFVLNLPYELRPYVLGKKEVRLQLPDGQNLAGTITDITAVVDSAAQTQNIYIKVPTSKLPVNLVARVAIEKTAKANAVFLPRQAVLANETQTEFWVMKVMDSTRAIKVPVKKGLETNGQVEILAPAFTATDQFVLTGNYGLADTATIKIVKP
ncbi:MULTISPECIES: efflux RND transporter periplasmic adaptor subunit [Niastella]|uniref:HlyD family efflux transporter periplasmic adaptor subunit n=1 Tax=Niastella soli TaxID=2821487 RepID=A0ABS3YY61_9BACT|nr:HlyD family efflux transporter periplasmic adaptor subunit [Niastella soli]MBO9202864.1 HlyD family efflux transporter periplasmic adaptor subunit [Niastella soli]